MAWQCVVNRETTPVSGVITVRQVIRREEANASKLLSKTFKRIVLKPKMGLTNKGEGPAHLCHSSPTTSGGVGGGTVCRKIADDGVPLPHLKVHTAPLFLHCP